MNELSPARRRLSIPLLLLAIALLSLIGYLVFGLLGDMYIADYDEARHGVNAYEMIRNEDYLVHTYQGQTDTWNLKPPLSFWLIALSYRLFGYNAFALRFFSALAMLLASGALAFWAYRRTGAWAGIFVLLAIAANGTLYGLHFARYGDADAQYQLFFTLAMLCLLVSDTDFRWLYGSALCFGLAFLEKGAHAFTIPAVCFVTLLCTRRLRELSVRRVLLLLLAGLVFIVPWAVARYQRDGLLFFQSMIATDVVHRAGSTSDDTGIGTAAVLYYLRVLWTSPVMVVCLALSAASAIVLLATKTRLTVGQQKAVIGCLVWFVLPVALYSIANAKYRWYIYSCLFALPALTSALLAAALKVRGWQKPLMATVGVAVVCLGLFTAQNVVAIASTTFHHMVQDFLRQNLERDIDGGRHAYIQYNESQRTQWMPADMLTALMYGDVVCMDGGMDAFLQDEDSAILFMCKEANGEEIYQVLEIEPVRNENYYMIAFDNG